MKVKHINESVLPIEDNEKVNVVADVGIVLADEIASKKEDILKIKKEMKPVMDQTAEVAKATNADSPADILESLVIKVKELCEEMNTTPQKVAAAARKALNK